MPKDPALEHIDALGGMPFRAFPGQDHRAHITAHLNFMATNLARSAPMMNAAIEKQEMANANRIKLAGMKPKTNGRSN